MHWSLLNLSIELKCIFKTLFYLFNNIGGANVLTLNRMLKAVAITNFLFRVGRGTNPNRGPSKTNTNGSIIIV